MRVTADYRQSVPAELNELLSVAARTLAEAGVAHALIGGCARNVYAPPRSTRDVDLAVAMSPEQYARVAESLRAQGFSHVTETRSEGESTPDVALFSDDSAGRIDLLLAHTDFEHSAIARAREVVFPLANTSIPVVRVEDLIIYKALAGRPRDLGDIEEVVSAQERAGTIIDWPHIERECADWEVTDVIERVRARIASR
jgi:predicted nucleotidyltransferase